MPQKVLLRSGELSFKLLDGDYRGVSKMHTTIVRETVACTSSKRSRWLHAYTSG